MSEREFLSSFHQSATQVDALVFPAPSDGEGLLTDASPALAEALSTARRRILLLPSSTVRALRGARSHDGLGRH